MTVTTTAAANAARGKKLVKLGIQNSLRPNFPKAATEGTTETATGSRSPRKNRLTSNWMSTAPSTPTETRRQANLNRHTSLKIVGSLDDQRGTQSKSTEGCKPGISSNARSRRDCVRSTRPTRGPTCKHDGDSARVNRPNSSSLLRNPTTTDTRHPREHSV